MLLLELTQLNEADVLNINEKDKEWEREHAHRYLVSVEYWVADWEHLGGVDHIQVPPDQLKAFTKKIRQLALNDPEMHMPVTTEPKSPEWARKSFANGTLVLFNSEHVLVNKLMKLVINAMGGASRRGDKKLFTSIMHAKTFLDMHHTLEKYNKEVEAAIHKKNPGGEKFIAEFDGEYTLVQLVTKVACEREGAVMQNCIERDYDPKTMATNHKIYIIKTKSNNGAVVSFDVDDGKVDQLTGKQNRPPQEKYIDIIKKVFKYLGVEFEPEGYTVD